ncbi:MAG: beta-mannosidase [Oscillospiraceae bacterium]|nr:beta-mannosidase [Oscillospiraceae bacterium]
MKPINRLRLTALPLTASVLLNGCFWNRNNYDIRKYQDKATVRKQFNDNLDLTKPQTDEHAVPEDFVWIGEAEDAELTGIVTEMTGEFEGYNGRGYVGNFTGDDDTVMFTVEVPADGVYNLEFDTVSVGSDKQNPVEVDGQTVGTISTHMANAFTDSRLNGIYLTKGSHKITAATGWGYYYVDRLVVTPGTPIPDEAYEVTAPLSDAKAFDNSKRLYQFLCDCYGRYTITGQYCDTGKFGKEMTLIEEQTGLFPAILGLDMMDYSPSRTELGGKVDKAVGYAKDFYVNSGGIVTMCWHWTPPKQYLINNEEHPWYSGFSKEHTTISLDAIADGTDAAGKAALLADIDAICEAMEPLKEAQVPILWRPLHEASGGWFWWGNCKPQSYLWLWNLLYDRMVNEHGLHNLIWVWNGQSKDWYPGDSTVDIIGTDIYAPPHAYSSQSAAFQELTGWSSTRKLIALTENGVMPDPANIQRDRAVWSWFCTWGGEYLHQLNIASENYTDFSMWDAVYQSEDTLALDDLPCLWTYPMSRTAS